MDADRFDAVVQWAGAASSRRGTLGVLLAGALGLFGQMAPDAAWAKSGKCKPACGACQSCKKGRCRKRHGRKRRKCKKGACQPVADGTACAGGRVCQGGQCACLKGCCAQTDCSAGAVCLVNGTCATTCTDETNCGENCVCDSPSLDGLRHCVPESLLCLGLTSCASTADCPPGRYCQATACANGPNHCLPLCVV
jgi:hypothetical protein